jgi:zeta-carotene desaturase
VEISTTGSGERQKEDRQKEDRQNKESFDYLVLALPFNTIARALPETPEAAPLRENLAHFESCPITGIHLWFDRQISDLDHAVLLDRTIQWMFHKSRLLSTRSVAPDAESTGSYIELVVSASKSLVDKSRSEIIDLALKEVLEFFPKARSAKLVKSTVIKEIHATYSPRPGIDAYRPPQATAWPRIFLAGDWTATGWPATMESAVRSGYLAAEAINHSAGFTERRFVSADLPATGLMRLFS